MITPKDWLVRLCISHLPAHTCLISSFTELPDSTNHSSSGGGFIYQTLLAILISRCLKNQWKLRTIVTPFDRRRSLAQAWELSCSWLMWDICLKPTRFILKIDASIQTQSRIVAICLHSLNYSKKHLLPKPNQPAKYQFDLFSNPLYCQVIGMILGFFESIKTSYFISIFLGMVWRVFIDFMMAAIMFFKTPIALINNMNAHVDQEYEKHLQWSAILNLKPMKYVGLVLGTPPSIIFEQTHHPQILTTSFSL